MSTKGPPSDLPIYSFSTANELEAFLDREHAVAPGFYLKIAKKSSGISTVSAAEAVETALCFGWIDGRANGFDDNWWLVRYTQRRPRSIWSKKNVATIERLVREGRMRPAGMAAVEAAKADGRWERAYAGPATIEVPDDLAAALAAEPAAVSFFESMNKTDRYSVLWRVHTASAQSRAKRVESLVRMLAEGKSACARAKSKETVSRLKKRLDNSAKRQISTRRKARNERRTHEGEENPLRRGLRRRPET
ncbi:MAG: hypothetical protein LQ351_007777 [Letrouitia transgressa]|nr:MAG: hypothetical protein LQ351_007777 [Letrouitia transgressa]